jgi:S1-C subfamily serine protease
MSVVASDKKTGVSVVRVAPNSPLTDHIKMGDVITKINNHPVKNPNDLTRLIMFSDKKVVL